MKENILFLTSEFPPDPGGIGRHAFDVVKGLSANGKNVIVICETKYIETKDVELFDNSVTSFSIIRLKRTPILIYFNRIFSTIKEIFKHKTIHVFLSGRFSLWQAIIISKISKNIHITAFVHGTEINLGSKLERKITKISLKKVNRLIAVSRYTKSQIHKEITKDKNVEIIPNGISNLY